MKNRVFEDLFGNEIAFVDTGVISTDERVLIDNLQSKLWTLLRVYDKLDMTVYLDGRAVFAYDNTLLIHENKQGFMLVSQNRMEYIDVDKVKSMIAPKEVVWGKRNMDGMNGFDFKKCVDNIPQYEAIKRKYSHFSVESIYATQLKIAAEKWADYLNVMLETAGGLTIVNNGLPMKPKESFVILNNGVYIPNQSRIDECIKIARKRGGFNTFHFFTMEIVLDELDLRLSKRGGS